MATKKELSYSDVQKLIEEAAEGHYYIRANNPKKTGVLSGAASHWKQGKPMVYAPEYRVFGEESEVKAFFKKWKITNNSLYTSPESEGYEEELEEYKEHRKEASSSMETYSKILLDPDSLKTGKGAQSNDSNDLKARLKRHPPPGRVYNVSDIESGKITEVIAPLSVQNSEKIGLPGLYIVANKLQAFSKALDILELDEEKKSKYLEAWSAVSALRPPKPQKEAKESVKSAKKVANGTSATKTRKTKK